MEVRCVTFPEDAIRKMGNSDLYIYSQLVRITSDVEQGLMGPTGTEAFLSPMPYGQDSGLRGLLRVSESRAVADRRRRDRPVKMSRRQTT